MAGTVALALGCSRSADPPSVVRLETSPSLVESVVTERAPAPLSIEPLAVPGDLDGYVLRGGSRGEGLAVFVPGRCVHPQGYMLAFMRAASEYGDFVGIQGDVDCGGGARRWSSDVVAMDKRIRALVAACGLDATRPITLIGYSQGAERIEWLHRHDPRRYPKLVLMSGPVAPSSKKLASSEAVALMAGTRESQALMRDGSESLARASVDAKYFSLPGARHGELGESAESAMSNVLKWLAVSGREKRVSHWEPAPR